jgi:hypothetical protein
VLALHSIGADFTLLAATEEALCQVSTRAFHQRATRKEKVGIRAILGLESDSEDDQAVPLKKKGDGSESAVKTNVKKATKIFKKKTGEKAKARAEGGSNGGAESGTSAPPTRPGTSNEVPGGRPSAASAYPASQQQRAAGAGGRGKKEESEDEDEEEEGEEERAHDRAGELASIRTSVVDFAAADQALYRSVQVRK